MNTPTLEELLKTGPLGLSPGFVWKTIRDSKDLHEFLETLAEELLHNKE